MNKRFPKILYWKWDKEIFNKIKSGLDSCINRFDFDYLYISFHHLPLEFNDNKLQELIQYTSDKLISNGKSLLLDIDARNELAAFLRKYPGEEGCVVQFWEYTLDEKGLCHFEKDNPAAGRTGRTGKPKGPVKFAGVWTFIKSGNGEYVPGSLCRLSDDVINKFDTGDKTEYFINAGEENAHRQILFTPVFFHGIPDLFSDNLDSFYSTMFDTVEHLPLGGAATDEWGYDLSLKCDDGLFYVDAFPYTQNLCSRYQKITQNDLDDDLINFAYAPAGNPAKSIKCINIYLSVLRKRMEENNLWFYNTSKKRFGKDAFVGVHPTLWGDPADFSVDIAHNGISWWEVVRDFAQTDEFVAMPIRLAMAHKWGGTVFYNMWYSGNTQQLDTYWAETWQNVRFGGRTHYLGYECPNEPGVYRLKHANALEDVDKMEKKVSEVDFLQRSQPDSRVLVIFGYEAVSNWYIVHKKPQLVRGQGLLPEVLRFTLSLFGIYLCDLAPSTEIVNGSIKFCENTVSYGTQNFDAVIYLAPECADRQVINILTDYATSGGNLILSGNCNYYNNGEKIDETFDTLCKAAAYYSPAFPSALETAALLRSWKIPENRFANGCVFQDGSLLFTANAVQPTGNVLEVDVVHKGKRIRYTGEDYYYEPVK